MHQLRKPEFDEKDEELLRDAYAAQDRVTDDLVGTRNFDVIVWGLHAATSKPFTHRHVWMKLLGLRKRKDGLPHKGRSSREFPLLDGQELPELKQSEIALLVRIFRENWDKDPDSMPYTPQFEIVASTFRAKMGKSFSDNEIHRMLIDIRRHYLLTPKHPRRFRSDDPKPEEVAS